MINVTPAAVKQIHMAASDSAADGMSLRVAAHFDDLSGQMQYGIGFDEPRDDDDRVDTLGVTLLISPLSRDALTDLTIDYVEIEPGDFRFVFIAPRDESATEASSGSGCGGCQCGSGGCGPKS